MRFRFLCMVLFVLSVAGCAFNLGAQPMKPSNVDVKLMKQANSTSFEPAPTPISMLVIGGALVLFGAILRRRLQAPAPLGLEEPLDR
jgi:hypothetical protein